MLKVTLLCIGALKTSWIAEGSAMYISRLGHLAQLDVQELPASKCKEPAEQIREESDRLLAFLQKSKGEVWILESMGQQMTSEECAKVLSAHQDTATPVTFVVGGAYGLDSRVRDRADRLLSLGKMTLPHELCRLVLLEQLYRALQIARGSGYHH